MDVKYCDICKQQFPKDKTTQIEIIGLYRSEDQNLDICTVCREKLTDLLEGI